jgi:hypothetical protein
MSNKGDHVSAASSHRISLPNFFAVALLIVFSAGGLMAGGLTFKLTNGSFIVRSSPTPSEFATVAGGQTPTPSITALSTVSITQPFTLSITLSPIDVRPGQMFSATVTAVSDATHGPVAGLRCYLDNPTDGSTPLLTQWPAATATDASGQARWTIVVPQVAPGTYEIGYGASGSASNTWQGQHTIQVIG